MKPSPFERAAKVGVIPVIAIEDAAQAEPLADALLGGGVGVAEITFRTEAAAEAIARMRDARPEMLVGAGTLLSPEAVRRAVDAGAAFGLAPGFDPKVLDAADSAGLPFAPGVMTPSDISLAATRGYTLMKFFPAVPAGGPSMLKNLAAPFAHLGLQFIPTGGVKLDTLADWLTLPEVCAVGGTWIAQTQDLREGNWRGITEKARAAAALIRELRA